MKGKKALGMLEWIMILALVVMVAIAVIVFFTRGINPLGLIIGKPNVATIVTMCQTACSPDSVAQGAAKYDFCERPRDLIWEDINKKVHKKSITCDILKGGKMIVPTNEKVEVPLPSVEIDCDVDCTTLTKDCQQLNGVWSAACNSDNEKDMSIYSSDKKNHPSESCCVPKTCTGTATKCSDIPISNCADQKGCKLSSNNQACEDDAGGVVACADEMFNTRESRDLCEKQDDCSWA